MMKIQKTQSPVEIYRKINNLPVYQQEKLFDDFEGLSIEGKGSFNCFNDLISGVIFKTENKNVKCLSLWTITEGSISSPLIYFTADLTVYPEIKHMKSSQKIEYRGKILKVTTTDIYVDIEKFNLIDEELEQVKINDNEDISGGTPTKQGSVVTENKKTFFAFLNKVFFHPVYSTLIVAVIVFLFFIFTDVNLKDFF